MIKFIVGLFTGTMFGFIAASVLAAGSKGGLTVEPGEAIAPKATAEEFSRRYFDGFEPRPDFRPDCPAVCGNCKHWDSEIFAWGVCKICKRSGIMREAGDVCNIRNGEVVQ